MKVYVAVKVPVDVKVNGSIKAWEVMMVEGSP